RADIRRARTIANDTATRRRTGIARYATGAAAAGIGAARSAAGSVAIGSGIARSGPAAGTAPELIFTGVLSNRSYLSRNKRAAVQRRAFLFAARLSSFSPPGQKPSASIGHFSIHARRAKCRFAAHGNWIKLSHRTDEGGRSAWPG